MIWLADERRWKSPKPIATNKQKRKTNGWKMNKYLHSWWIEEIYSSHIRENVIKVELIYYGTVMWVSAKKLYKSFSITHCKQTSLWNYFFRENKKLMLMSKIFVFWNSRWVFLLHDFVCSFLYQWNEIITDYFFAWIFILVCKRMIFQYNYFDGVYWSQY